MNKEPQKSRKIIIYTAIIAGVLLMAFFAGISGELFTRYYLSNFSFFRDLYFTSSSNLADRNIIIQEPKKVVVEQDLRLTQLKGEIEPAIATIYSKKKTNPLLLDRLYTPEDYLGQAVFLTSDGWLITADGIITKPKENVVVTSDKKIYNIEKVITDPLSKIAFIKISADNLPVIQLADWENVTVGQQVAVFNTYSNQTALSYIKSKKYKEIFNKSDLLSSSNVLDKTLLLSDNLARGFKGSPIVSLQGDVIAVLNSEDQAILLQYIKPVINQILKGEQIKRPYLGVNYINLSDIYGLNPEESQGVLKGALIAADKNGMAIAADSPLNKMLAVGDVITNIEGQNIDKEHDLLDIILEYKSGQQIRLKYLHEQKEQEISLTL